MNQIAVISPTGKRGKIPLENLQDAITQGGFKIADPMQKIRVIDPNGKSGKVPAQTIHEALTKGGFKINLEPEGDSWSSLIGKAALKGISNIADIPSLVGQGVEYLTNNDTIRKKAFPEGVPIESIPKTNFSSYIPTSGDARAAIKKYTDFDLEPHPTTAGQRIASNTIETIGNYLIPGMREVKAAANVPGLLNKFIKTSKVLAPAAAIGGTSGVLQEGGVDPLVADLGTSIAFPIAGATSKNLLNKFSSNHKKAKDQQKLASALKEQIGEENLPTVLENIKTYNKQKKPINLKLTTPEVSQDAGLATLYRSTQSNSPNFANRHQENNKKLLESLEGIGTTGLPESVKGEAIRAPFVESYNKKINKRHRLTEPLYKELESVESGLNTPNAKELLEKEISVASPGNKAPLEKYYKALTKSKKQLDPELVGALNVEVQNKRTPKFLFEELNKLPLSEAPRPIQIENTIQELGDKVNSLSRSGELNSARRFGKIKKAYEDDLATNPVGLKHREEYKRLSQPINQIETSPLLHNFVKKNRDVSKLEGFTASSEKLPNMILNADLANTKILVNKAKGNKEILDLVKGTYIDKLLELSKISGGKLSYDKANKFINNKYNKEKLDVVFNSQERKKIDQYLDTLKRRSNVESAGRVGGPDTHQKFKIEREFNDSLAGLGKIAEKTALKTTGLGGIGSLLLDVGRSKFNNIKNRRYNSLLEEALLNPAEFQRLMTKPNNVKGFRDFYNPVPAFITGASLSGRED